MKKIFINGSSGTTGLQIHERLEKRNDIQLLEIDYDKRHDPEEKKKIMNAADAVFFCLPDDAAREDALLVENPDTVVIDTSTAHRTDSDWVYGMAELSGQREKIISSKRIANPGCHASGFIALTAPLVEHGLLNSDLFLSCTSFTGYTGGGKKMIADYGDLSDEDKLKLYSADRVYGLTQNHKHLKEMVCMSGLTKAPAFFPAVGNYPRGMETVIGLSSDDVLGTKEDIIALYKSVYQNGLIYYKEDDENGFLSAAKMAGRDDMEIAVYGNEERIVLTARFDNLGKGASGAAIQNMNLALGFEEKAGLVTGE